MPKRGKNYGAMWSLDDIEQLKSCAEENLPVQVISLRMGRTVASIQAKAHVEKIKLRSVAEFPLHNPWSGV